MSGIPVSVQQNLPRKKPRKLKNLVSRHRWGTSTLSASAPQAFREPKEPILVQETKRRISKITGTKLGLPRWLHRVQTSTRFLALDVEFLWSNQIRVGHSSSLKSLPTVGTAEGHLNTRGSPWTQLLFHPTRPHRILSQEDAETLRSPSQNPKMSAQETTSYSQTLPSTPSRRSTQFSAETRKNSTSGSKTRSLDLDECRCSGPRNNDQHLEMLKTTEYQRCVQ